MAGTQKEEQKVKYVPPLKKNRKKPELSKIQIVNKNNIAYEKGATPKSIDSLTPVNKSN